MTTEEMQKAWEEMSKRLDRIERNTMEQERKAITGKRATALDNLAARYRKFSTLGLVMTIVSPVYFALHVFSPTLKIWGPLAMMIYFGLCSVMDYGLYKKVKDIDVFSMTAEQVSEAAALCKRRHFQCMAILIPLMFVVLGMFLYGNIDQEYMVYGIIGGFIIGLTIGLIQLMNFMSDYRFLRIS